MNTDSASTQEDTRICPYYRLRQIHPPTADRVPDRAAICTAVDPPTPLSDAECRSHCRSGAYPMCRRFRAARSPLQRSAPPQPEASTLRRLFLSALWVVGIPTAITLVLLIAMWFTEKVWVPTQQIVLALNL